jgi:hypothetical protein
MDSVPHDFPLYTDSSASTTLFQGAPVSGSAKTTYSFIAPGSPGSIFFRFNIHPAIMTGAFIVL